MSSYSNVNKVLDHIDAVLSETSDEARLLWDVLTSLRGNSDSSNLKRQYTVWVRSFAFPRTWRAGVGNWLADFAPRTFSRSSEKLKKELLTHTGEQHTVRHLLDAIVALVELGRWVEPRARRASRPAGSRRGPTRRRAKRPASRPAARKRGT